MTEQSGVTLKEASEQFSIPVKTLYSWWKRGLLPGKHVRDPELDGKVRGVVMLDSLQLAEYLAEHNYRPVGEESPATPAQDIAAPCISPDTTMGIRECAAFFSKHTGWNIEPTVISQWARQGFVEVEGRQSDGRLLVRAFSVWQYLTTTYKPRPHHGRYRIDNPSRKERA